MSVLFTDRVDVVQVTRDATYGTNTLSDAKSTVAYVEDDTEIRFTANGQLAPSIKTILLPRDTDIAIGDFVRVTKLHGENVTEDYVEVKRVSRVGGMRTSHLEVLA